MINLYATLFPLIKKTKWLKVIIAGLMLSNMVVGQISVPSPLPFNYSEGFNTYTGALATLPAGWTTNAADFRGTESGGLNSGGARAYVLSGDYALGVLRSSSSGNITHTVTFTNSTGAIIQSISLSWKYKQFRFANLSGLDCSGTGALAGNATLNGKDFTGAASGSAGATTLVPTFTLTGLTIANGASFGISWVTTDDASSDNGLAIDDFTIDISLPCTSPTITAPGAAPTSQSVCQNSAPTNLTIAATGTAPITYQWYSNTINSNAGGTSVGAANGGQTNTYTPPTTIAGTVYYYCIVTGCSTPVTSAAVAVTVTTPPSATIAYPGTPFCSNAGTEIVTRTGTTGGTYSAAAGLSLNSSTGDINTVTSTAGTYTITYSLAATGGCPIQTATTSVTITALPAATITYPAASFCKTAPVQSVTRTGTTGGAYTVLPAGLTINSSTGAITPSTSAEGNYTVTYTMTAPGNGCTVNQTTTTTVSVVSTATTVSPAATQDLSVNNDGTILTVTEGDVPVSRQWKYGTVPGGPYGTNLGTGTTLTPNFPSIGTYYIVCVSTYPATPCGGATVTSNEVRINVTNNTILTTAANYGPFCNNSNNPVTVNFTYSPAVNFPAGTAVFTAQLSDGSGSFAAVTNIGTVISDGSGSQSIAASIPSGVSGGTNFRIRIVSTGPSTTGTDNSNDFIVGGFPSASISYPGAPYCNSAGIQSVSRTGTAGGTYSSSGGLAMDPSTGAIDPAASTPGTYTVSYDMPAVGTCPAQSTTTSVTITGLPAASISYVGSPFCSNGGVKFVIRFGTPGGTYSSTAGLTINSATGAITPLTSTVGTYIVTYTMPAASGCPAQTTSTSITITQAPAATISYAGTPFCSNDFTPRTVTQTGTTGGTYTASPSGLSINASTGEISVFSSSTGTYTVTYSMNGVGGCPVQTATTSVTISAAPVVADITGTTTIGLSSSTTLADITAGGVWTSSNTGVATINAASGVVNSGLSGGTTIIRYTVTSGGCSAAAVTAVNVIDANGIKLWENLITDPNPSSTNPFTAGQIVNANVSVSGIGYTGVTSTAASNRFNTNGWNDASLNTGKYIYFTLTPDAGYAIDFTKFVYTGLASGSGPVSIEIRSSDDGFLSSIGTPTLTGTTISLTGAVYQNVSSPITFRVYLYGASSAGGTFSINDFAFYGNLKVLCPSPTLIDFIAQPTFVGQDAVMSPVLVRAKCADGTTAAGYTGSVALSVFNGCGYTTQTVNAVGGIATFNNIIFRRSAQSDVRLQAFAAGFAPVTSDTFSVTAPGSVAGTTTLVSENFEAATTWAYTVGADVIVGSGGSAGTGVVTKKTFSGNQSLVKSYSVDNSSGKLGSTNTITFANQLISAAYSHATFNFKLASLGTGGIGSGAGHDNGEQMVMEISLNGGTQWDKLLTYSGNGDYLFNFSAAPVVSLAYNANATYGYPSTQSAFTVSLPSGSTQFRFRITATNNRTNENWAIDDLSLVGTAVSSAGVVNPMPTVTGNSFTSCPGSNKTITVVTGNTIGVVSYVWTPATNISNTTISNPVVNPPAGAVYTAVITDADGCTASGTVTIGMPGGTSGTWTGANNTDWFQCENWGGGVIPTSATNVTIPAAAINVAEIDPLSTFAAPFIGVADVAGINVDNKTLKLQANARLNVAGNLTIQNSGLIDMTNGGQIYLNGSWTNSVGAAGFTAGTGTINYAGNANQTIAAENYYNLTSSSTGARVMAPAGVIGISGAFTKGTNAYTFTNSTVNYNAAGAQTITPFTADPVSVGKTYENLTLSNTGVKSLSGATDVESDLTLSNNIQLALGNNYLTLKSTAGKTARVAPVAAAATISYATGRFVVERYYPARRAWRLVTAPVTVDGSRSLFNSWQVGGSNNLPGSGTYITGSPETPVNGLDVSPQHNFSLKTFNPLTSQFDGVQNTKSKLISGTTGVAGTPDNLGYFLFVRGDRTPANVNAFNPYGTVNETTLRDTGKIQVQSYTFPATPSVGPNKYTLIGNPYASPVDFASISRSGVVNKFQAWDPKLNTVGGYVVVDLTSGLSIVPVGSTQTQVIQSSQAIIVETNNASSPFVSFSEAAKSSANNLTLFRPVPRPAVIPSIAMNLYTVEADGSTNLADGVLAQFGKNYADGPDQFDALKFGNVNETFSIVSKGVAYILQRRSPLVENDTIFLNLKKARQLKYKLKSMLNNLVQTNLTAYLEDGYLKTSTPLSMTGDTWIDFAVNDAASAATDRFYIVFRNTARYTAVNGYLQNKDVLVQWTVQGETDMHYYEVERSVDGETFTKITTVNANSAANNNYNWIDENPAAGVYYYRIKATNNTGATGYSETVKVVKAKNEASLYVFPNPVSGNNIQLFMNSQPAGKYSIRLTNVVGEQVLSRQFMHPGGSAKQRFEAADKLVNGTYHLEVTGPDNKTSTLKIAVLSN